MDKDKQHKLVQVCNLGVHPRILEPIGWIPPDENPGIALSVRHSEHHGDSFVFNFINSKGESALYFEIPKSQLVDAIEKLDKEAT